MEKVKAQGKADSTVNPESDLQEFIRSMPKAELHLHLEVLARANTIQELDPSLSLEEIQTRLHYSGFAGFLKASRVGFAEAELTGSLRAGYPAAAGEACFSERHLHQNTR